MDDCRKCGLEHPRGAPSCPGQRVGTVVAGKYRLLRLLGQGGMGAVYEAEHLRLSSRVALKVLHPQFASEASLVMRFGSEARQVASLKHPGIVDVRDAGVGEDGSPFLEMELLIGESVGDLIKRGPIPAAEAVRIISEALTALAAAHAGRVVHRDLKPDNLFVAKVVDGKEQIKILDFGIAKALGGAAQGEVGLTETGYFLGTPHYMSPEQLNSARTVDHRADLYSMGATLYAMLTGQAPVAGSGVLEVLANVANGRVRRRPSEVQDEVPAWLDVVVATALAPRADERYQSAQEMRAALDAGGTASVAAITEPRATSTRPPRGRGAWLGGGGLLVAAGLAYGLWPTSPSFRANPPGPGMVRIPGASLDLGSPPEVIEADYQWCRGMAGDACRRDLYQREQPVHRVTLSTYDLDVTEVTNATFAAWLGPRTALTTKDDRYLRDGDTLLADLDPARGGLTRDPASGRITARPGFEARPVVQVTWAAADQFCRSGGKRLPTEAEWELAARGSAGRRFPWGDALPESGRVVYAGEALAPVATAPQDRTPEGVRDLGGNAAEWVLDAFHERYPDCGADCTNPVAPESNDDRVIRGGYFDGLAESCRAAGRSRAPATEVRYNVGFRCARPLADPPPGGTP